MRTGPHSALAVSIKSANNLDRRRRNFDPRESGSEYSASRTILFMKLIQATALRRHHRTLNAQEATQPDINCSIFNGKYRPRIIHPWWRENAAGIVGRILR